MITNEGDSQTIGKLQRNEPVSDAEKNKLFSRSMTNGKPNQQWWNEMFNEGLLDQYLQGTGFYQGAGNLLSDGGEAGAGYEGGEFSKDKGTDTGWGNAISGATSLGNAVTGGFLGSGVLGNAVAGVASGKSNSDIATDASLGLMQTGFSMMGLPGAAVNAGISAATSNNLGSTLGSAAFGAFGGVIAGPPGAIAGSIAGGYIGTAVKDSFNEGFLGDVFGTTLSESEVGWGPVEEEATPSTFAEDQAAAHPSNNASGFLGDPDIDSRDRTDATTPGGLMGNEGSGTDGSGEGQGATDGSDGGSQDGSGV